MGRTTPPLPGRPMPIHSNVENPGTTGNGANSQRSATNVIIPSVPGGCEDVLRDHRTRLLDETSTTTESAEQEAGADDVDDLETIMEQFKQLQEQNRQILAALQDSQTTKTSNGKNKVVVSKAIASEVRLVAKKLRDRMDNPIVWDFTKAFRDDVNEPINEAIEQRVQNVHKDVSAVELKAALKSHFMTRRKRSKRERAGGLRRHQQMQRKTQRKQNLIKSRCKASEMSTTLSPSEKTKIKAILKMEYISSEESMSEDDVDQDDRNQAGIGSDDEGGPPKKRKVLVKHPLPWRSPIANQYMESLDRKAMRRLSERSLTMLLKRKIGEPSRRPKPAGPQWALRA